MKNATSDITPDEIRAIRHSLGLTQVEAGELMGGGPRSFTKYEAGTVRPAAAVVKLLLLLEADPRMLKTLAGHKTRPMTAPEPGPFSVSGEHIAALTERTFAELLRRLLSVEAQEHGIPASAIHVASPIYTPDGGEDGRIEWTEDPDRTPFLPCQLCQFQLKAGKIGPAEAGHDVLIRNGEVKPMVRSVLEAGGHYIMLCAHAHVQREIEARKTAILRAIRNAGLTIHENQIDFRDADQIAHWVNHHAPVAIWVRDKTQPGLLGPFRSWSHWAGRPEHDDSPWIEDERLIALRGDLRKSIAEPRTVVRVVGLSGVGKTRLVLEAMGPTDDELALHSLSDLVLYAVESEVGATRLNETVQSLADDGRRAIVVVDECAPETHRDLSNMVLRRSSRLSLVTVDHEVATGAQDQSTLSVDKAPHSVTKAIIDRTPLIRNHEDQLRLARFCKGFPKIAFQIGQAWIQSVPVARATDDDLVDAFVLGRRPQDRALLLKSAALLATFGLVYPEPLAAARLGEPAVGQLAEIARLGNLAETDLGSAVADLRRRGVVQSRGRAVLLQPRPIAMRLAERQWQEWSPAQWDDVLAGDTPPYLKRPAAEQLALINTTETAQEVTRHVCRPDGPLDGFARLSMTSHANVLSSLAGIDPAIVAERIERLMDDVDNLRTIDGDIRRHLVWALERIAFDPHTFKDGARLLLRLSTAENESISNNATGRFRALFPVLLGSTAADGDTRLSLLDEVQDTSDAAQRRIVVEALSSGSETHHFMRFTGAEAPGSRPAFEPWRPATQDAAIAYITGCVSRLTRLATRTDQCGTTARSRLAHHLRSLVSYGFIDVVETAVDEVLSAVDQWREALEALGDVIVYEGPDMASDLTDRVRGLIARLRPNSLESRVRLLVTEMPWDYPCDEDLDFDVQQQHQREAVRALAQDLVKQPTLLAGFLPQMSRGEQRMAFCFGRAVAELSDTPLDWLTPLIAAASAAPETERNYDLLVGFVVGISENFPDEVDAFKKRAVQSSDLAPALPLICSQLGISTSDLVMVLQAFNEGLLDPLQLTPWRAGRVLTTVSASALGSLIDAMLVHSAEGFAVAVRLMDMYAHGAPNKLDGLQPQIRKVAENATRWDTPRGQMTKYYFGKLMTWMLDKGRDAPEASSTALALAQAMVDVDGYRHVDIMDAVVPKLLSGFPEIAWPLLGQAIVSSEQQAWRFEHVLGNVHSFEHRESPPLLSLPENTLFAWCHAHPDRAPEFAAAILPFLTTYRADATERELHPVMARILSEFGDRQGVVDAISSSIGSFGWSGSLTTYYAMYERPMRELVTHPHAKVRRWAQRMLGQLSAQVREAHDEDEERSGLADLH